MENVQVLTQYCSSNMTTTATVEVSTIIYDMGCRSSVLHTRSQLLLKLERFTYLLTPRVRCYCSSFVGGSGHPVLLGKTPICRVGRLLGAVVRYLARSDMFSCR